MIEAFAIISSVSCASLVLGDNLHLRALSSCCSPVRFRSAVTNCPPGGAAAAQRAAVGTSAGADGRGRRRPSCRPTRRKRHRTNAYAHDGIATGLSRTTCEEIGSSQEIGHGISMPPS
eukprot:1178162-Prorocentrum_minimum.AAC.5